ncbi:MAG: DUF1553 domain-containing protein [Planctomycetota bacterium]|nr:DUF1553 domain-containing protein [Planctomycetota bacterium]MDA1211557.1 DUF1553 domain-containing protein [Planctomycetota bacterium]
MFIAGLCTMSSPRFIACIVLAAITSSEIRAAEAIVVLPQEVQLAGPRARQRLLVELSRDGKLVGQLTEQVTYESSAPDIVKVEEGIAIPLTNGTANVTVKYETHVVTVPVVVTQMDAAQRWSFRNHVQSVLTKTGCNSGACHGAAAGKNGFKLSLRGYDPENDFLTITRQSRGRRIVPSDPGRSLFLTKPTGVIPHKGGIRFEPASLDYAVLAEWLAAGHPAPAADDPRMTKLEILPQHIVVTPGQTQQLSVLAHFSDGHVEEVTQWAKFSSTNVTAASVDDNGFVTVNGSGETAIVAWYLATNVVSEVTVPYSQAIAPESYTNAPTSQFIDDIILEKLEALNLPPSPPCDDATFLRRVYLDTIGQLPTAEETRDFLNDTSPDKRHRVIEYLLSQPSYVDYWSYRWSDLLLVSSKKLDKAAVKAYYQWVRDRVAGNTPWDQFAREIVTARGNTIDNGAANFFALHQDSLDMAETVSMAFLGMSINCARCHDHPLEKWTNDDYYAMANLFSRVRGKSWSGSGSAEGKRVIFTVTEGELIQPRTGKPQPPSPLDGRAIPFDETADRRTFLADWLTSPENPYFTRAIVNRVWANYMGVGIVESIDDLRLTNPPSNEKLLSALCDYLVQENYDLKALMRVILQSQTYQRSSEPVTGNENDERFYSRYYPRRLSAEVLLDAFSQATAAPTTFKDYPEGTRAIQLPDVAIDSAFLNTFGRPERVITCECERSNDPSMVQVLHLVNGDTLNGKLKGEGNAIDQLLARGLTDEQNIEHVFLSALSRFPTDEERQAVQQILTEADPTTRRLTFEDLYWSLLSSREFLFKH